MKKLNNTQYKKFNEQEKQKIIDFFKGEFEKLNQIS